jgi:tetratricopeptide (TPR) repeat protein
MEFLYNPDSMPEEEVKATFIAREWLIDELVSQIKRQPDGAGIQQVLIIAPRGMGKTTVLLMVKFGINDSNLSKRWQAVKFPEESYGVYDLADFWLEVLDIIAADTDDQQLRKETENLRSEFPNNDDLQEAALALIKDWRRKNKKRLVLLVDNFDMILEQINDERDGARLREVLMNDGAIMMIGCAVSFFAEARSYDKPLYNFFKTYDLVKLKFEQIQELLRRRARLDRIENFEETLKANQTRLRVLEYFTGGNPRLVLMLYRVVTQSDITEAQRGLEKLLDEVTPYFKSKVESLPPQLRKILDHIARVSSKTNEGLTPTEIAQAVRLTSNQVSAQLKRLSDMGYVRAANLRGRSSYYALSEPLYAIWHQMRFGRDARERMQWLVNFLKAWYDAEEMGTESTRLETRFREFLSAGRMLEARDALQHRRYLAEAMDDSDIRTNTIDGVVRGYLDLKDTDTIKKELLASIELTHLSEGTLKLLYQAGCISKQKFNRAKGSVLTSSKEQKRAEIGAAMQLGIAASNTGKMRDAIKYFEKVIKLDPSIPIVWCSKGTALLDLENYEEAIENYDRSLQLDPEMSFAWGLRGIAFHKLGKYGEAIASYDRALEIKPQDEASWYNRGLALANLGRYEEAIANYNRTLEIKLDHWEALSSRGVSLIYLGRYEEAVASYDSVLEIDPQRENTWYNRGLALSKLGSHKEAIKSYDHALQIEPDDADTLTNRGASLGMLGRYEAAIDSFDRALNINPDDNGAWYNRTIAYLLKFDKLMSQGKINQAKKEWVEAANSASHLEKDKWYSLASDSLQIIARRGYLEFAQQLIEESDLSEPLFPLDRAIDYLLTGDEALIEKLSPEIRGIVEEIVAKLRNANQSKQSKTKTRAGIKSKAHKKSNTGKSKSGSRNRIRKKL